MWIVSLALRRPYTFIVLALLIALLGVFTILRTPTDIFPNIKIPVVATVWRYSGLSPDEMATRLVLGSERSTQVTVNDVEHTESQSLSGIGVVKYFFQPNTSEELSYAQITAMAQTGLAFAPPGTTAPYVLAYNASTVPVLQLAMSSEDLSEAKIFDLGNNILRTALATVPGATMPWPYGGLQRQVQIDLDPDALRAQGLSGNDVTDAIAAQNLILPAGVQKIGDLEYFVELNASPKQIDDLNSVPVTTRNGSVIYVRDVAHVRDGYPPQTNIARRDGRRAVLQSILQTGSASTLDIIRGIKERLPHIRDALPPSFKIDAIGDQSIFVRGAITGVVREGVIAASLTALMVLLFLGSWRSTVIIAISIPLSILASIIALSALGETMNTMTLGGLALAIGILVDDATVTIENIHRHMERQSLRDAVLMGASEIATPTLVSTMTICIVFVSVVFLTGPAKYLFTPMALAVVFAMIASYIISRTLVPVMVQFLLGPEHEFHGTRSNAGKRSIFTYINEQFDRGYGLIQNRYVMALEAFPKHGKRALIGSVAVMSTAFLLLPFIGRDFFPAVDAGQIRLHVRAHPGTRIENTKVIFSRVEEQIRKTIPDDEINIMIDDIGLAFETFNYAFGDESTIGPADGEILIALKADHHPTADYVTQLRAQLQKQFPDLTFSFEPADIVTQILDFGVPAPIDVQVRGFDPSNYEIARRLRQRIATVPGAADVYMHQVVDAPGLQLDIDRERAGQFGLTQQDVANSIYISLSSSAAVQPNFWIDPKMGLTYMVAAQTPQRDVNSIGALENTPIPLHTAFNQTELLSNMAKITPSVIPQVINHHNGQPVFDIYANTQHSDLGSVATRVERIVKEESKHLPPGTVIEIRGQVQSMNEAFTRLGIGLIFAALLVYLLMVINYQSWLDPFIIICALPGAFCGIVWALFLTQTTFNVPSLMGAIMSVGVATANSILLVTFANELRAKGIDPREAAVTAGHTRLRPIVMTAVAMIIGMVPMALGLGEGGEQNAPLARAVIGGLGVATFATLFFVPLMFTLIHGQNETRQGEIA